jgi:hypothetical protein
VSGWQRPINNNLTPRGAISYFLNVAFCPFKHRKNHTASATLAAYKIKVPGKASGIDQGYAYTPAVPYPTNRWSLHKNIYHQLLSKLLLNFT